MLTFWHRESTDCLQIILRLATAARALRSEGRDIIQVLVSMDPEAMHQPLENWAERWGVSGRDPELATTLGVWAAPHAFLVDSDGQLRSELIRGTTSLETQIRTLFLPRDVTTTVRGAP